MQVRMELLEKAYRPSFETKGKEATLTARPSGPNYVSGTGLG